MNIKYYLDGERINEEKFRQLFGGGYVPFKGVGNDDDFPNTPTVQIAKMMGVSNMTQRVYILFKGAPPAHPEKLQATFVWNNGRDQLKVPFKTEGGECYADFTMTHDWWYDPKKGGGPGTLFVSADPKVLACEQVLGFGWFDNHLCAHIVYEIFDEDPTADDDGEPPVEPPVEPPEGVPIAEILANVSAIETLCGAIRHQLGC